MKIIKKQGVWRLFDKHVALIITDEKQLETIIEDPAKPLFDIDERGFSGEKESLYKNNSSLVDICREGQRKGAERLEVSYDFFFGGSRRSNYPDSEITVKAFKIIHDVAEKFGMGFSASIISPLDIGGGYAKKHENTGQSYQYKEGAIDADSGIYSVDIVLQKQWYNNKGPIQLELKKILVYAFKEEQIEGTNYYYVNPDEIMDISDTAQYVIDNASETTTKAGYGYADMKVFGRWNSQLIKNGYERCLIVVVYKTPEIDYFHPQAFSYIKGIIDLHRDAGINYQGFYSDEMHIQFDWDLGTHFGHDEINTRYITDHLMREYARRYGDCYLDFPKYLIYFSYHQHDFLENEERDKANQHVLGKDEKGIYSTWLFRKRYFEMLQDRVVELSIEAKKYAEGLFGSPIMTRAHATWQESPTCDRFSDRTRFSEKSDVKASRYEYTTDYIWSSSIRENISACYDYFKWNDFLTGGGTDHPEGGNADRNYYAQALASSFGVLNEFPYAYCGSWGSPKEVLRRLHNVGITYGNMDWAVHQGHNMVQGISHRTTDIIALYPLELNYVEERFGSWMVQYGYCNYITEDKLEQYADISEDGFLVIKDRRYRAVLIMFEPFIKEKTLDLLAEFVERGGKVIWTSIYPVFSENNGDILDRWKRLFGIKAIEAAFKGKSIKDKMISFHESFHEIEPMEVLTDMLPDLVYPIFPEKDSKVIARCEDMILGSEKRYESGGTAIYMGFRPRDDQSGSTGKDISTLFAVLMAAGAYSMDGPEALSRPAKSTYIMNRFVNGAISIANHYRSFYEEWSGQFFRDEIQDEKSLRGRALPSIIINLENEDLLGHSISYVGIDVLTYNVDDKGNLVGFAGSDTTGITIDGCTYTFVDQKADIAWTIMPEKYVCNDIKELYMVRVNKGLIIRIPLSYKNKSDYCYHVEVCDNDIYETTRKIPFTWDGNNIMLKLSENDANKWIAIYQVKKGKR